MNDIIAILIIVALVSIILFGFFKLGKDKQIKIISEWLILAVIQAEKELGGGTGQVKLRYVYDMFLSKFKIVAMFISFEFFSGLVDVALVVMKQMIINNKDVRDYIDGIKTK